MPPRAEPAVIQATFAPSREPRAEKVATKGREPAPSASAKRDAKASTHKAAPAASGRPPHPATVAQKREPPQKPARPPHPAAGPRPSRASAQPKGGDAAPKRPPHPATVPKGTVGGLPPHPAAQPKGTSETGGRPPHPATLPRGAKAREAAAAVQASFAAPAKLLRFGSLQPGKPIPTALQAAFEAQFDGADLSAVRIHEGPEAEAIGALALTAGDHVFFAPGQYRPETKSGRALLGRQIAYVLQQREGRVKNPFGSGLAVVRDPALDAEASARSGAARR